MGSLLILTAPLVTLHAHVTAGCASMDKPACSLSWQEAEVFSGSQKMQRKKMEG